MADLKDLKEKNKILQENLALQWKHKAELGEIATAQEKINAKQVGWNALLKEQSDYYAQDRDAVKEKLNDTKLAIIEKKKEIADMQEKMKLGDKITEKEEVLHEIAEEKLKALKESLPEMEKFLDLKDEEIGKGQALIDLEKKRLDEQKKAKTQFEGMLKTFTKFLGIGIEFKQTVIGGMITGFGSAFKLLGDTQQSWGDRVKALGGMVTAAFSPSKIAGMIVSLSEQLLTGMDKAQAGFFKATQANEEFGDSVMDVQAAMVAQGLGFDDVQKSMTSLYNNLTAFKNASEATRKELGVFVSTLTHLGIEAETTTQVMQIMNKSLGMTMDQTKAATEELVHFAKSINMSAATVMSEFGPAMQQLAAHGDKAIEVFKGLQKQSRATGISVTSLMGVAKQFDTFDSAAQSVGRLNGILGGAYLNSIEMVYATEEERMEMMRESLTLAGKSFDAMSRHEKMMMAEAGGFASVAEAAAFYNTNLDDPAVQERMAQEEKLADMAKQTDDIMTKLKLTMMQFAITMKPVIEGVRSFLDGFGQFMAFGDGWVGKIILLTIVITKMTKALHLAKVGTLLLAGAKKIKAMMTMKEVAAGKIWVGSEAAQEALKKKGIVSTFASALMNAFKAASESAKWMGPFSFMALPLMIAGAGTLMYGAYAGVKALAGYEKGTGPGGAPGGPAIVNEAGEEGIISGGRAGIIPGGPRLMNLKKGDEIIPNKNLGGPSAKDIGKEVASAVQGALSVKVDIASPDGKKIFDVVKKEENRNFRRTMQNRSG